MRGSAAFGVVVIGRNEGERLVRCLESLAGTGGPVIYVDSGSTDTSIENARRLGAHTLQLDLGVPFTAARARNVGFQALLQHHPDLRYVQFVDGDCEVVGSWIARAVAFLEARDDVAVACGRRRERYPEASIYNLMCDREWDTPVGEARACGGDAMFRVAAFRAAGGYRDALIAGEEPELCVRLRAAGWKIYRLDEEMTVHDAAMTRFSQWWKRSTRAGYAFAEGARLHGGAPERHWVKESRRALVWGLGFPVAILVAVSLAGPRALALASLYPAQVLRLAFRESGSFDQRLQLATYTVLGKFAEASGALRFHLSRYRRRSARLIEYK